MFVGSSANQDVRQHQSPGGWTGIISSFRCFLYFLLVFVSVFVYLTRTTTDNNILWWISKNSCLPYYYWNTTRTLKPKICMSFRPALRKASAAEKEEVARGAGKAGLHQHQGSLPPDQRHHCHHHRQLWRHRMLCLHCLLLKIQTEEILCLRLICIATYWAHAFCWIAQTSGSGA